MTDIDRNLVRRSIRQRRLQIRSEEYVLIPHKIQKHLEQSRVYQHSKKIGFYLSYQGEVETETLIKRSWALGKDCYLPIITRDHNLKFLHYFPQSALNHNRYGILEPAYNAALEIDIRELDLVFVPLLAFDKKGNRLGSGAGYYDRTFAFRKSTLTHTPYLKPYLMGLAYDWQQVEKLTSFEHDVPLDGVITEAQNYQFK